MRGDRDTSRRSRQAIPGQAWRISERQQEEKMGPGTGVQDILTSFHLAAVSDRVNGSALAEPPDVAECLPADLLVVGDDVALLRTASSQSGFGCPDPLRP